jgi:hypothetical protein
MVGNIPYTPRVKKVLSLASKEAKALTHTYVGTEHILLGLLREGDGVAARVLRNLDVDIERVRREILKELDPNFQAAEPPSKAEGEEQQPSEKPPPGLRAEPKHNLNPVDVTQRYDVYCVECDLRVVVYRDVRFNGVRSLFPGKLASAPREFFELEHPDGKTVLVAAYSVVKFCEAGVPPRGEITS